jgi:hypothetical protein
VVYISIVNQVEDDGVSGGAVHGERRSKMILCNCGAESNMASISNGPFMQRVLQKRLNEMCRRATLGEESDEEWAGVFRQSQDRIAGCDSRQRRISTQTRKRMKLRPKKLVVNGRQECISSPLELRR